LHFKVERAVRLGAVQRLKSSKLAEHGQNHQHTPFTNMAKIGSDMFNNEDRSAGQEITVLLDDAPPSSKTGVASSESFTRASTP
jgi:hypothetical protein